MKLNHGQKPKSTFKGLKSLVLGSQRSWQGHQWDVEHLANTVHGKNEKMVQPTQQNIPYTHPRKKLSLLIVVSWRLIPKRCQDMVIILVV